MTAFAPGLVPHDPGPIPQILAGRYRVIRELGRGGMGVVYLVEHIHTGDQLALKLLLAHVGANPQIVERFKREARAPARIKSEHVTKITDADVAPEVGGAPFRVMELLEGKSLEARLHEGKLAPREAVVILAQLARALEKAHALGVVHRDLKPDNLFLHRREDGSVILKILDFGISKFSNNEGGDIASAGMTSTGTVMGTPLYMSPEQARGLGNLIGPPTDIWAVGLIAFYMLVGRVYWRATVITELILAIVAEPLPAPSSLDPSLPPAFDAWFYRSCDRDPARRWPTVTEQIAALAQLFDCHDVVQGLSESWGSGKIDTMQAPVSGGMPTGPAGATTPRGLVAPSSNSGASGVALATSHGGATTPPPKPGSKGFVLALSVFLALGVIGGGLMLARWHGREKIRIDTGPVGVATLSVPSTPVNVPPPSSASPTASLGLAEIPDPIPSGTSPLSPTPAPADAGAAVQAKPTASPRPRLTGNPTPRPASTPSGRFNPAAL